MRIRSTILVGGITGLVVSCGVLALVWFGVSGVLRVGHTDLMYVLWPSSLILIGGWHTTQLGIILTICSVIVNCLMYVGLGLVIRWAINWMAKSVSRGRAEL